MSWLKRLRAWFLPEDTRDEARQHMRKLDQRDDEIAQLGRELRAQHRRNHFSGMVDQAIHRTAREGP